jgi:hypothetical protein
MFLASLAVVALAPSPARAAGQQNDHRLEDDEYRSPIPLWYTAQGGWMVPAGHEGLGLDSGPQATGTLGLQMSQGFVLGGDLGIVTSRDQFSTRIVQIGLSGRLLPNVNWPALYVQGGAGFYFVSYSPSEARPEPPPDKVRPGMNFGIGYDMVEFSRLTFGVIGTYHGIVIARSDALAYINVSGYVSLRPAPW